ncbi:MAG: hypothetical protein JJU11_15095 [Candidatus Sumerlaeia bacterium]|nr:hypothetical protein [Candidatus Sumerlaeia bacterium]
MLLLDDVEVSKMFFKVVLILFLIHGVLIPSVCRYYLLRKSTISREFIQSANYTFDDLCRMSRPARIIVFSRLCFLPILPLSYVCFSVYLHTWTGLDLYTFVSMSVFAFVLSAWTILFLNPIYLVDGKGTYLIFLERRFPGLTYQGPKISYYYLTYSAFWEMALSVFLSGCMLSSFKYIETGESLSMAITGLVLFLAITSILNVAQKKYATRYDQLVTSAGDSFLEQIRASASEQEMSGADNSELSYNDPDRTMP